MIPVWLPVVVPWAGAALLAALSRRPAPLGPAVALASFAAAAAFARWGGAARPPDALAVALLLAGAAATLLASVREAAAGAADAAGGDGRFVAAGFPLLQGSQALVLLAVDPAVAWIGLAVGVGGAVALVALPAGRRRAFAAAWRTLLLCGAGLAAALLGVALLRLDAAAAVAGPGSGLSSLGFVLLLLGHGAVAGLAPLNAWLPRVAAVAPPPVTAVVAGLLPPAALFALVRSAEAAGPDLGGLPPAALLAALGLATVALAAFAEARPAARAEGFPGRGAAALAGLAAVGFGVGGAAGNAAGALLALGLPFCVGAAALGAATGGPVAALGRLSIAGMPPFAPFAALLLLFSALASLRAAVALPVGAVVLVAVALMLGAAARRGAAAAGRGPARGGALAAGPAWVLLGLALVLGAALPEPLAAVLAGAAAGPGR